MLEKKKTKHVVAPGINWIIATLNARDLQHFVELLDFTPHEAIIAATRGVAAQFMRSHELGRIQPGYYADCILVDGNPLEDIRVLQDHSKLNVICINGRVHKAGRKEYVAPPIAGQDGNRHVIVPDLDLPEVEKKMQKQY